MVKYIKNVLFFFVLIVIVDVACGFGFDYLKQHAKGGDTRKNYYIAKECDDDIIILGSSRAARHYVPSVIHDSLGLSCYNCGEQGCGIITAFARFSMIRSRHKPKLVVYEVSPEYDYFKTDDYSKYLGKIRQYADEQEVRGIFLALGDDLEGLRILSNLYRNNSSIVRNIADNLTGNDKERGFKPLYGVYRQDASLDISQYQLREREVDSLKLSYLEKLVDDLRNDDIPLCFVVSPRVTTKEIASLQFIDNYEPIRRLSEKYNIPFYYHMYLTGISDNVQLFQDAGHLNKQGAFAFSKAICSELNDVLKQ